MLHAHPPYAIARSIALEGAALHPVNFEARLVLGSVPMLTVVESAAPDAVAEALGSAPIVIVRGHGSFAMAGDPWQTLNYTTTLEEAAQILTHARDGLSSEGVPLRRAALLTFERDAHERWHAVVDRTPPEATREGGWASRTWSRTRSLAALRGAPPREDRARRAGASHGRRRVRRQSEEPGRGAIVGQGPRRGG